MKSHLLATILLLLPLRLAAQLLFGVETDLLDEVDSSLFATSTQEVDPYSESTKFYRVPLSQRRRGLDYWLADEVIDPITPHSTTIEPNDPIRRLRFFGSTKDYNIGAAGEFSTPLSRGWNLSAELDLRSGRDLSIEGLFTQDARASVELHRHISQGHTLAITLTAPLLMRGLQNSASQEAITLTGDNRYNSAWGLYNGEVRNSRVMKYAIPKVDILYLRPIDKVTHLRTTLTASAGRRGTTRLGWYDAYNPLPDYYRKLPSYASNSSTQLTVEEIWHTNDPQYTQIAWDKLIRHNQLSTDGSAHYIVEKNVELRREIDFAPTIVTSMSPHTELSFGARISLKSDRNFKELDDLLGAEYHLDHDLFIGDNVHLGNDMQNDLRNPERRVGEGERFGYDYTSIRSLWGLSLGVDYRTEALSLSFRGVFGEERLRRKGHFEKERFGGSQSYGSSATIKVPNNSATIALNYPINNRNHLTFRGSYLQCPNDDTDTFVQIQNANRAVDSPTPQRINSLNIAYRYSGEKLSLDAEGYLLYTRGERQVWAAYDDLAQTYTDVVVSGLGRRSIGVDLVAKYKISKELEWELSLAAGDYTYDTTPTITLYDDSDMSQLSSAEASAMEGCKVGNAPQLLATSSLTYFPNYRWIFSLRVACGAGRYVEPSPTRRSDRVAMAMSYSPELSAGVTAQESLPALFDATLNVTKMIYLRSNRRIAATLRINNLLGDRAHIEYGRESSRIFTTSAGSSVGSQYLQPNYYIYGTPRTIYLSCSYTF